jgi:hypothetical protein
MNTASANLNTASRHAANGQPFKASALTGTDNPWRFERSSQYSDRNQAARYDAAVRSDLVTYVVHSYAAPIAWCDVWGDWHAINVERSVTTSRHRIRVHADLVRKLDVTASTFWALFDDAPTTDRAAAESLRKAAALV